jgi:ABC-type transport system involved in cytochrome bd biosynthesis fused ATPase/permease subunit
VIDRTLGAMLAAAQIAAALFLAHGIADLAGAAPRRALVLLALAILIRAVFVLLAEENSALEARAARVDAHHQIAAALSRTRPDDLHDLDTTVDAFSARPALDVLLGAAVASIGGLALVGYYGGWVCLLIVVGLFVLSGPAYAAAGRSAERQMAEYHRRRSALVVRQLRLLRSITDLRGIGAVAYGADEIAAASQAENAAVMDGLRRTIRSSLVTEFLGGVSVGLVAMDVGLRIWHHSLALLPAVAAVLVTAEVVGALRRVGAEFHRRDDASEARRRLATFTHATPVLVPTGELLDVEDLDAGAPCGPVSLRVAEGERIGLRGPSGVGKTSTLRAALGLAPMMSGSTTRGAVRVGYIDASAAIVPGTLRENLDLDGGLDERRLTDALQEVGWSRPGTLDDSLGDDGDQMSAGQRVQLAVARSLLAEIDLLVLDDVAGALDADTRRQVGLALSRRPHLGVLEATGGVSILQRTDRDYELVAL